MVQEGIRHFLSRALAAPLAGQTICAILVEGIMRNNSVIFLNLDQWFRRRCHFKIFLIWSSGGLFVQQSGTIYAISVEGIMRNNSEKLFKILTSGSVDVLLRYFLSGALAAILFS